MRTKMNIKLKLESYLEGGYPIRECIDFFTFSELDFYNELINLISSSKKEEAIDLATKNFGGYYHICNVDSLNEKGFKFLETEDLSLNDPFIEELKEEEKFLFLDGLEQVLFLKVQKKLLATGWIKIEIDMNLMKNFLKSGWTIIMYGVCKMVADMDLKR